MALNFWRPLDMEYPVRYKPLAVCDPSTVDKADVITTALKGFTPTGIM